MDVRRAHAVDVRLGISQFPKDTLRRLFDYSRQPRLCNDVGHIAQMTVRRLLGRMDVHACAGQPATRLAHGFDRPPRQVHRLEQRTERCYIQAGITQRTQNHIATDTRETVEVDDTRHSTLHAHITHTPHNHLS